MKAQHSTVSKNAPYQLTSLRSMSWIYLFIRSNFKKTLSLNIYMYFIVCQYVSC